MATFTYIAQKQTGAHAFLRYNTGILQIADEVTLIERSKIREKGHLIFLLL